MRFVLASIDELNWSWLRNRRRFTPWFKLEWQLASDRTKITPRECRGPSADVAVILDAQVTEMPVVDLADPVDDELVRGQVIEAAWRVTALVKRFVLLV